MTEVLLQGQNYLFYLIFVMIIVGIIKENEYFVDFVNILIKFVPSKRAVVALVSLFGGILPIPGRVTVSAGLLDTIAPIDNGDTCSRKSRSKFGIIDYLSTHIYYLFSPLEKTIIIPMAVLSLTYLEILQYMLPLIVISLGYVVWYIFGKLTEKDIQINTSDKHIDWLRFTSGSLPVFVGIGFLIAGFQGHLVFGLLAIYYIIKSQTYCPRCWLEFVNWKLVGLLAIVIALGNYIKLYDGDIHAFIENGAFDITTPVGFITISSVAFLASFAMGSSSKYAGIVALLATIYGVEWLTWFVVIDYAGYLLSPTHKCTHIGRMYFGTRFRDYYTVLGIWCILMTLISFVGFNPIFY